MFFGQFNIRVKTGSNLDPNFYKSEIKLLTSNGQVLDVVNQQVSSASDKSPNSASDSTFISGLYVLNVRGVWKFQKPSACTA